MILYPADVLRHAVIDDLRPLILDDLRRSDARPTIILDDPR